MGCDPVDGQCLCKPGWEGQTCASDLCQSTTTVNCGRYDELITCKGWNTLQIRNNSLPIEYKLYNICASLDETNQNEVCLTVEECKCSPGFTGSYCSQELNSDVGRQTEKSSDSTPIITAVSVGVVVVVIVLVSIVVFTIRTRNTKQANAAVDNKTYGLTDLRKRDGIFPNAANMNSNRPQSTNFANLSANLEDDVEYDRLSRRNQPNINHNQAVVSEDTYTHMTNQNTQTNDEYDVAGRNPHFYSPDSTEYGYSNFGLETSDYDELDRNSKGRRTDHSSSTYSS
ncbi:hypothetical protein FSP39_025463 [Pinctada imbricata]|uniref:EGF-like domain-containing protein n=1 Tax=Pinctada imbricata TaxID=66713 RepID=A0AA88XPS6_PINIB|nr:hypothetical protein FSP39_025463 [Pinctada imbricata]